ncbi:MAG: cytochrome C [Rhodomicrobium sp.]
MITRIFTLIAISAAAASCAASAQEAGDPAKGFAYAGKVCAECHAIREADEMSSNIEAPSFEDIANTPGVTGMSLAASLHSVHENMPNFVLAPDERDNVVAYILSLGQ